MRGRLFWLGTLLTLVIPLFSGASCAWVLWEKVEMHGPTLGKEEATPHWELRTAAETKDDCETMLLQVWQIQMHETTGTPAGDSPTDSHPTPGFVSETHPQSILSPLSRCPF